MGLGRLAYEQWEKQLPKRVKYISLQGAEPGFWKAMGFSNMYRFPAWIYKYPKKAARAHGIDDACLDQMWKGIHGKRTPKTIAVSAQMLSEEPWLCSP